MNCSSESMNLVALTRFDAATVSLHVSVGRKRVTRKAACVAAGPKPARFSPLPTTTHEWAAVQEMFSASRPRFVALAYSVLRNKEDAEDAVQDAMLSAYRHLRSFEGRSALTTWFTRIVINAALMIRRKRKPARIEAFPDTGENDETSWIERIPAPQPDPEMVCAGNGDLSFDRRTSPGNESRSPAGVHDGILRRALHRGSGSPARRLGGNFQVASLPRQTISHPTNAAFSRRPYPLCNTHTVFFPQKSVRAFGRKLRGNPVSGSCVRMTGAPSLNHFFRSVHAGT